MKHGTLGHRDSDLLSVTLSIAESMRPPCIVLENVWGFALAEGSSDAVSPLDCFRAEAASRFSDYTLNIFVTCGSTFMVLRRRRLFITMVRDDIMGGEQEQRFIATVKEFGGL